MTDARVGLANPYALAELAVGRKVNWKSIPDPDAFVEKTLGVTVEELTTPVPGNLVVSGMAESQQVIEDVHAEKAKGVGPVKARAAGTPFETMLEKLTPAAEARVIGALTGATDGPHRAADTGAGAPGYTPPGAEWYDPGEFFAEGAEFFDPVQGGLGDCYFIAALAAVAWARPYVIALRERVTGPNNQSFVDQINFYSSGVHCMEVTEQVPLLVNTHAWIYGRSSEPGEIWPAVYEKAFAKWRTNDPTDQPNYAPIAGGWPVQATSELTGLTGVTKTCSSMTADEIWNAVRSNCLSCPTFNPMTAWTFCSTPPPVNYAGTGIVGYHAYTILGWAYVNNTKYIVIRNPWGNNGPVINALQGSWSAYDQSFWRSVPLNAGGVFAIPAQTFKTYYWQFGWAA